jgi:hypothetical protein
MYVFGGDQGQNRHSVERFIRQAGVQTSYQADKTNVFSSVECQERRRVVPASHGSWLERAYEAPPAQ